MPFSHHEVEGWTMCGTRERLGGLFGFRHWKRQSSTNCGVPYRNRKDIKHLFASIKMDVLPLFLWDLCPREFRWIYLQGIFPIHTKMPKRYWGHTMNITHLVFELNRDNIYCNVSIHMQRCKDLFMAIQMDVLHLLLWDQP